jgi:Flp pilus assembly protein TadD
LQPNVNLAIREYQVRRQGKLDSPLAPLQKFAELHPKDTAAALALAQAAQETGDRAGAVRAYQSIIDSQPGNAAALNNLAWLKYEDRDPAALGLAKRAYAAAPKDPRVADTYAWLLVENGQVKEGLALLAPIAGTGANEEIRIHYAQALAKAGRRAEAREIGAHLTGSTSAKVSDEAKRLVRELDQG